MDALQAYGSSDDDADSNLAGAAAQAPPYAAVAPVMTILPPPPGPDVAGAFPDAGQRTAPRLPPAPKRRCGVWRPHRTT